ncbi:MAG: AAA family ATPase [Clostridium sp.]|nr:AAA family ATPase [Clostridium sp.]
MKLYLENFAKIKKADIELNGITVIAGENNTGKSTIGKALYCIFNSFYDLDKKLNNEKVNKIMDIIYKSLITNLAVKNIDLRIIEKFSHEISLEENLSKDELKDKLKKILQVSYFDKLQDNEIEIIAEEIIQVNSITKESLNKAILNRYFSSEFKSQINNVNKENDKTKLRLEIKNKILEISFEKNSIIDIKNDININTDAIYIDSPFVMDDINSYYRIKGTNNHRINLINKLTEKKQDSVENIFDEIINNKKLENVISKLSFVATGKFKDLDFDIGYQEKDYIKPIYVSNLSTGLKNFTILQRLIENGYIVENGLLILDEPEIHLHPEWQIIFAEILVILHRDINLNILLNTHSPYFLNALEVYSAKYKIEEKCKYYSSELKNKDIIISDVTNSIDIIYKKLSKPFQTLEDLQYRIDEDD